MTRACRSWAWQEGSLKADNVEVYKKDVLPFAEKLPEALETRCAKCTDKQKQMGKALAQEVKKNHPDIWKQLVAMYDPEGKYQQAWQDFLKE